MNIALWIAQGVLAVVFLASGAVKSIQPKDKLIASGQTGVAPLTPRGIKIVAALELLGAIGIILPWLTGIAPVLTPLAAVGLALVMVGAAVSHWSLREYTQVYTVNLALFCLSVFVAVGRFLTL